MNDGAQGDTAVAGGEAGEAMMRTVAVDQRGMATSASIDSSRTPLVQATIRASQEMPATTLSLFADPFVLDAPQEDLFGYALPGAFGAHLLRAPLHFGWDHAATIQPADLDRLLSHYAERCVPNTMQDLVVGKSTIWNASRDAVSDEEDEEELDDEEELVDDESVDEDVEEEGENFSSDEDDEEQEECEDGGIGME